MPSPLQPNEPETHGSDQAMPGQRIQWASLTVILGAIGTVMTAIVTRWTEIEPVLESPATIVISMLLIYALGGLSAYWLLARPHEERLARAEQVINRLRERERDLMVRLAELGAEVAALKTTVDFLKARTAPDT